MPNLDDDVELPQVASFDMTCPDCPAPTPISIGVFLEIRTGDDGHQEMLLHPDMTELYAHAWMHQQTPSANS